MTFQMYIISIKASSRPPLQNSYVTMKQGRKGGGEETEKKDCWLLLEDMSPTDNLELGFRELERILVKI